jgi:transcription termination factor Rho
MPLRIVTEQTSLGIIDVLGSGAGFIRRKEAGYIASRDDYYVGPKLIQRYGLRTGDEIFGVIGGRPRNGKAPPVNEIPFVNGHASV